MSDEDPELARLAKAAGWGLLSASSLVFGAIVGIARLPSSKVRATLMAFGGGALIEALSIELFAHILHVAHENHNKSLVFLAVGSAIVGGLVFATLDHILNSQGAFLRSAATLHTRIGDLRNALTRRLVQRLRLVPMFETLPEASLHKLARSMVRERYNTGDVIFRGLRSDSSVYFLLTGKVELTLRTRYGTEDNFVDADIPEERNPEKLDSITVEKRKSPQVHNREEEVLDNFILRPNDVFGEMALLTGLSLDAEAVALMPTRVLQIPPTALHRLLASNHHAQNFVMMMAGERLRESDVFRNCSPSSVARLVSFMNQVELYEGDVLFYDVDSLCPIYFVVLGRVEVRYGGKRSGARIVSSQELLGTEHLVFGEAMCARATALERTTVLQISRADIDKLCDKDQNFRQTLLRSVTAASLSGDEAPVGISGVELSLELEKVAQNGTAPKHCKPPATGFLKPASPKPPGLTFEELGWLHLERENTGDNKPSHSGTGTPDASWERERAEDFEDLENGGDQIVEGSLLLGEEDLLNDPKALDGHGHGGVLAAKMIWLGILLDSVPESVVLGILVTTASSSSLITFACGVFLANFPEAMSSSGIMRAHGMKRGVIIAMWFSITVVTGLGAGLGAYCFPPGSEKSPKTQSIIACIEGCCGGAMLCMIANTVLPEAFEQGGNVVGMSTLIGFLVALTVSAL